MVNHPHDCPVCDEGGECHLQDMTVMTGHVHRRYRFTKRTHRNQELGPFVHHEMNRCIQCYRCVRFYRDFAGGRDDWLRTLTWFDARPVTVTLSATAPSAPCGTSTMIAVSVHSVRTAVVLSTAGAAAFEATRL